MRRIPFIAALLFAATLASPAAAQSWKEYAYPTDFFSVAFPADPKVETTTYQAADGRPVDARVYSVSQDGGVFRMTVAYLPDPAMQESAVLDHAVRTLSQGSAIKVDIPHRISRVYGRQLSIAASDGGYSSVAVFITNSGSIRSRGRCFPAQRMRPPTPSGSSNRWPSPTIRRTGDRGRDELRVTRPRCLFMRRGHAPSRRPRGAARNSPARPRAPLRWRSGAAGS